MLYRAWCAGAVFLVACSGDGAESGSMAPSVEVPEVAQPYDEAADAQAEIEAAVAAGDRRVLLIFGANWCVWCRRLEHVLRHDEQIRAELEAHWRVVHVDVGSRHDARNRELATRYGDPLSLGLPSLVVLDAQGGVALVQETGSLEEGDRHVPARVLSFLRAQRG